jgi:phenylalanyl-tRNA synthetase beta chain
MPGGGVVHVPLSWIGEFTDLPGDVSAREVGDALVRAGLEVEGIDAPGEGISGQLVVGRVLAFADEPQKNGKTIRWCTVDVGDSDPGAGPRGIVCGAHNFATGDLVVVALPGTVLPGGFEIAARKTYGHVSDGMICSGRELALSDDHTGILVLPAGSATVGTDARDVLGMGESVFEISVTPDRGYCLSIRGLARELATALGVNFRDIADSITLPAGDAQAYPVTVDDPAGCDQFSVRAVTGLDPSAPSPSWMQHRLRAAGMRSISLIVDVTNYVMLETGQPLHAFDRGRVQGALGVRRAISGEKLTTLDGSVRLLDPDDLVVTDESGPVALAGVMGGAATEIIASTTDVVLEAAHWDPSSIARAVRRHRLPSEAAKRFERGVDPAIAGVALQRCVDLLVEHGKASAVDGYTVVGTGPAPVSIDFAVARAGQLAGMVISPQTVVRRLTDVGCRIENPDDDVLSVWPPTWRPDLQLSADLVEEVVRLEGYDKIPSALPTPPPGRGWSELQQLRRAVSRALAAAGATEVLTYPFISPDVHDAFGLTADDPRRHAARLVNPLSDAEPQLRTSLLPGLLAGLLRNIGRGNRDFALYEMGLVYLPAPDLPAVPHVGVEHRPSAAEVAALNASVPAQPRHVAVVFYGDTDRSGWWGAGRGEIWADAIEAARVVARAARAELEIRPAELAPWHPGRSAALLLDGVVIGHAGELHPRVAAALELPARVAAMELDLDAFAPAPPAQTPTISAFPPVLLDVALVVDKAVQSADVLTALREGAGELLESVRLFDSYADDERLGPGLKSLAFALRLRAPDRTLTTEQATEVRDAAISRAARECGAQLRS